MAVSADVGASGLGQVIDGSPQSSVAGYFLGPTAQAVEEGIVGAAGIAGMARTLARGAKRSLREGGDATVRGTENTSVYRSVNAAGETQYVGITKNLEQRAAAHLRQKGIVIDEIPGLSGLSMADARAVEQVLIEFHGLGKSGGTLLNKINSIARTNQVYADALRRGAELLKGAGYPGF